MFSIFTIGGRCLIADVTLACSNISSWSSNWCCQWICMIIRSPISGAFGWDSCFYSQLLFARCLLSWGRFLIQNFRRFAVSPNFFATNLCDKVGHRRTAKMDRAISMDAAERKTYEKSTPGLRLFIWDHSPIRPLRNRIENELYIIRSHGHFLSTG